MRILAILLAIVVYPKIENFQSFHKTEVVKKYYLNKDSVEHYPIAEVMAAIAYHECYNLSQEERFLVMEAFCNRVEDNFNNNGKTVKEQLLAPKQFTGLWKYHPQQFRFDSQDSICIQNYEMAKAILTGYRLSKDRIYYWSSKKEDCNTKHGRWMRKVASINEKQFRHLFK